MLEETGFTKDSIISVVKDMYDIDVYKIEKLDRGSANLYSLNDNTYILKEFQSKYTTDEITKEIEVINHLKNDGLLVPEYVPTKDNQYSFIYNEKIVILQKYIDGYTMESNTGNKEQVIESARELGKMVLSLQKLKIELPNNDVSSWYKVEKINRSIEKNQELIKKVDGEYKEQIIHDLTDKISMLEYVRDNLNFEEMQNLTSMNTHGDYSVLQFIYKDEKIKAIIDFVAACKMPIVWEVIRSYSYIDVAAKDGQLDTKNLIDYVKEFCKYVKLNKYDIKYMTYLYLIQLLNSDYGYKQYIADKTKESLLQFGFFRTRLCKYLFDNAKLIAKELEKEILEELY